MNQPDDPNDIPAAAAAAPDSTPPAKAPRRRARRWLAVAAAAGVIATLGACAQSGGPMGMGGMGGWHGRGAQGPMDPERAAQRIDRGVDRMLSQVDATPEQKQRVSAIAKQAMADLAPLRGQARDARRQATDLLAAPVIDRAAVERLRAAQVAAMDQASRRMSVAMADMAEVLTPEQRAQLKARLDARLQRRGG